MNKPLPVLTDPHQKLCIALIMLLTCFFSEEFIWADSYAADWYNQAVEATKREAFDEALGFIDKALNEEPRNDLYLAYQSHVLRLAGQYSLGQAAAEKAVSFNSKIAWYHVSGALNSYHAGDWISAGNFLDSIKTFSPDEIGEENLSMISWVEDQMRERVYELYFRLDPVYAIRERGLIYFSVPSNWPPGQSCETSMDGVDIIRIDRTPGNHVCWVSDTDDVFEMTVRVHLSPVSFRPRFASTENKNTYPPEIASYLESSDRININSPLLKEKATEIIASIKDSGPIPSIHIQKATAIMAWLKENMIYRIEPFDTVDQLISRGYAECGGHSALFVGFCRVMGIPAREVWGVIETTDEFAPEGFMKGHLWAEFFLSGIGWVPVDPQLPWTLGQLPPSYVRICHYDGDYSLIDFKKYRPNGNLSRLMWQEPWGDIVPFQRRQ